METNHYSCDRVSREQRINNEIGMGEVVDTFYWDKGHKDGPEIHKITSTGIIDIYNAWTGRHITKLIARPGQIYRYYEMRGEKAPQYLIDIAKKHQEQGCNMW